MLIVQFVIVLDWGGGGGVKDFISSFFQTNL